MENNILFEEKQANLHQALNRQEGAYVPNMVNNGTASIAWAGKKTVDIMENPAAYVEALNAVFAEMWVDGTLITGNLFSPKMQRGFDTLQYQFGPDGNTPEHIQASPMKAEEYDQLIADPDRFVTEVLLPRRHPKLFEDRNGAKESLKLYAEDKFYSLILLNAMAEKNMVEQYGVASVLNKQKVFETPLDILFDQFRGFRGTLTDLRRQPANVKAALDRLWELRCVPKLEKLAEGAYPYAVQFPHIPAYLSPKQFDELYWVHEKQIIERIAAGGGKAYIVLEGRWEKIWHRFLELPKDSCILHVDDDDMCKANAELGHHQILCGGLKSADTRLKSLNEIKDDIKRVIDECAPGGGFLFCTDKAWIAPGDVNQTLIDAYNFAQEYSKK